MDLRALRLSRDLSTRELATLCGLRPSQISDVENGRLNAAGDTELFEALSKGLGIPLLEAVRACRLSGERAKLEEPKGPGMAFMCGPDGCKLVPTMDGKPTHSADNGGSK